MITFKVVPGKNHKMFISITNIVTKQDLELYDIIKKILARSEYFPFLKGFDKTVHYSYLFNDYIFPATFWTDVRKQLIQFEPDIELQNEYLLYDNEINREDFDEWIKTIKVPDKFDLSDEDYLFQQDSVFLALQNKIGRISVTMSGGKTFITYLYCRYIFDHKLRFQENDEINKILIVVPSQVLAKQLQSDFKEYDEFFPERHLFVETIFTGAKKLLNADIVCGTYQSLAQYEQEYFNIFQVMVCDELHRAKSYSIRNEIYSKLLHCDYFFGMTGTEPEYKTLDYLHITSMFGKEMVKLSAKEAMDKGISTPVKIYAIKITYIEDAGYSQSLKDAGIVGIEKYKIEKNFFQNHDKRTNLIVKLLNAYSENSIIMVDTVEYCQVLYDYLSEKCDEKWKFVIIHGKIKDRPDIIQEMRDTENYYCIIGTYGTMSTGISINNLENIYFPDGGKSDKRIKQSLGRGMRLFPKKEYCKVFDFQDMITGCAFKNHAYERNKLYKKEKFETKEIKISI